MLASEARTLVEQVGAGLHAAGVPVGGVKRVGPEYWQTFVETVTAALDLLAAGES